MLEDLLGLVQTGYWKEARMLADALYENGERSDVFWLLNASIYQAENDFDMLYTCIICGIRENPLNYELYYMLGDYYVTKNINQAYLCYEYADFCCNNEADKKIIQESMQWVRMQEDFSVQNLSIVIIDCDDGYTLQDCKKMFCEDGLENMYEVIIVKQNLHEGIIQLKNHGIKQVSADNDVLFMNSNIIISARAIFCLRMGVYERKTIGAVAPSVVFPKDEHKDNKQLIKEDYMKMTETKNIPVNFSYENRIYLDSNVLLLKRKGMDTVGLFDEQYSWEFFSDYDYGMELTRAGYELLLCHGVYASCYDASKLYGDKEKVYLEEQENMQKIKDKWGYYLIYYSIVNNDMIRRIQKSKREPVNVLDIGCGYGASLAKIKYLYPHANVYGIELVEDVAKYGKYMGHIIAGDIEIMRIPYEKNMFDYIFFGDVLEHLHRPDETLRKIKEYLKPDGKIIACIPNIMNISVVVSLLKGNFTYKNAGLLDRTHIHFFTLNEIKKMFDECGYEITYTGCRQGREPIAPEDEELITEIYKLPGIGEKAQFETYQYIVEAVKK